MNYMQSIEVQLRQAMDRLICVSPNEQPHYLKQIWELEKQLRDVKGNRLYESRPTKTRSGRCEL